MFKIKITNIINKLFYRTEENKEVVLIKFNIPTREELIKTGEYRQVELLDKYKNEYSEKLKLKLLHNDISSKDLTTNFLRNQDIILRHISKNKCINADELLGSGNQEDLLEAKLEYLKLYILSEENDKLYRETMLRYAALSEIKDKKLIIRSSKRRAIINELDSLYKHLVIFYSNNYAVSLDFKIYLIKMNEINNNNIINDYNELLIKKKNLVISLANTFIKGKGKLNNILNSGMKDIGLIAFFDIELEKYLYEHIENFKYYLERSKKCEYESDVIELEKNFLLLNECKYISDDELEEFYESILKIIYEKSTFIIKEDDFGFKYYKKIVSEKLLNIINGKNNFFNNTFKYFKVEAIKLIKDEFTNENSLCDVSSILKNVDILRMLLSFDYENGFMDFLSRPLRPVFTPATFSYDKLYEYKHLYDGIVLNESVCPNTFYELAYLQNMNLPDIEYKLYCIARDSQEVKPSDIYRFPDGISKIDFTKVKFDKEKYKKNYEEGNCNFR